jgi:multisubunit Na+/H+ antiporter MnhB subunit
MQTESRVFRLSGLIAVLGLLALLIGWLVMLLAPAIGFAAWAILALGVLLLVTAFLMDFRRVGSALAGRRGRFGTGATVMVSIFIGIILLINAISIGNYHRFDVTGVAQFTLTSQTKEMLGQLEAPVQVLAFFVPGDPIGDFIINLLNEYQNYSDQLSVEAIDPDEHPDQARQYNVVIYPSVVFESLDRDTRSPAPFWKSPGLCRRRYTFSPDMGRAASTPITDLPETRCSITCTR